MAIQCDSFISLTLNIMNPPSLETIRSAYARIRPHIHRTPVLSSQLINKLAGASLFFKCENLQKVGAFKARGASNAVFSLNETEAAQGVVTHSSGNHAAALAMAAGKRGIPAYIVMPDNAPETKKKAVASYGGKITFCEPTLAAREANAQRIQSETGANMIHPYNDYQVIAGQGTAALELLEEIPDLDIIMAPVGGGGLLSGTAIVSKGIKPQMLVIGTEPDAADDARRSLKTGHIIPSNNPQTICDGLLTSLGDKTFPLIQRYVDDIVTASESSIMNAMRLIWSRMKLIVEPSACPSLAAIMENKLDVRNKRIGIILTGGNVDLDLRSGAKDPSEASKI